MNISKISNCSFKGVYLSNGLEPGQQRELGKQIRLLFNESGLSDTYEKAGQDILIDKYAKKGIKITVKPYQMKRILDDKYSRWNGKFN